LTDVSITLEEQDIFLDHRQRPLLVAHTSFPNAQLRQDMLAPNRLQDSITQCPVTAARMEEYTYI
jgi:hypothetical protein